MARAPASVFVGAVAYVPVALVAGYASWNSWVAILLVIALSYGLCSRRVIVGLDFLAIIKFGPYRLAPADSIISRAAAGAQDRPHLRLRRSALLAASGGGVPTA